MLFKKRRLLFYKKIPFQCSLLSSCRLSLAKKLAAIHVFTDITPFVSNQFLQLNCMMSEAWVKDDVWEYYRRVITCHDHGWGKEKIVTVHQHWIKAKCPEPPGTSGKSAV
jgi:hypothetical protein